MKKLALAFAAAAVTLAFAAPASAEDVQLRVGMGENHHVYHRAPIRVYNRAPARRVMVVHHDRGWHRGWEHNHAKKIVIRHRGAM